MSPEGMNAENRYETAGAPRLPTEPLTRSALIGFVRTLSKRKRTVLGVALLFFLVVGFFTFVVTPEYESSADIYIRFEKPPIVFFPDVTPQVNVTGDISMSVTASMREMVWSRVIAEKLVREFQLDKPEVKRGLRGRLQNAIKSCITGFFLFLDKVGVMEYKPDLFRKAVDDLIDRIDAEVYEGTSMMAISYQDSDKKRAQTICSRIVELLEVEYEVFSRDDLETGYQFALVQLPEAKVQLEEADRAVEEYKQQAGIISLPEQLTAAVNSLKDTEAQLRDARVKEEQTQRRLTTVRKQLADQQVRVVSAEVLETNPSVMQLKATLYDKERSVASLLEKYTEDHPDVKKSQAEVNETRKQLRQEVVKIVQSQTTALHPEHINLLDRVAVLQADSVTDTIGIQALAEEMTRLQKVQQELPGKDRRLTQLQRHQKSSEEVYLGIRNRLEELERLRETPIPNVNIRLADPPFLPKFSDIAFPPIIIIVLATPLLALLFGIAAALLAEYFDNSLATPEEVEQYIGLPVLAAIPGRGRNKGRGKQ